MNIEQIDLKSIAAARPEIAEGAEPRIAGIKASPDGAMIAILLPSLEIDLPDQIWLYRVADRKLVAATPKPDQKQPHPDGAVAAIKSLAWQGGTLYARVANTSHGDKPYAISVGHNLLVWSTRNQCGDEFLTEQDESEPERFCLAHLSKPEGRK